jgi:hypothetical protein
MTADSDSNLSDAVVLYLRRYPGTNDEAFNSFYGPASADAREQVRLILMEAMQVEADWSRLSLNEAGDYVESEMHKRYPELSPKALEAIGNYYTYLMR